MLLEILREIEDYEPDTEWVRARCAELGIEIVEVVEVVEPEEETPKPELNYDELLYDIGV